IQPAAAATRLEFSAPKGVHMRYSSLTVSVWLAAAFMIATVLPADAQFYSQHNLVSDGAVPADHTDPNMVNAWGLVSSPTSPWWISDNGTGRSTLYTVSTGAIPLIVTVPGPMGRQGTPTGVVFNGGSGFVVNNGA